MVMNCYKDNVCPRWRAVTTDVRSDVELKPTSSGRGPARLDFKRVANCMSLGETVSLQASFSREHTVRMVSSREVAGALLPSVGSVTLSA
jgi:hypothetical protein